MVGAKGEKLLRHKFYYRLKLWLFEGTRMSWDEIKMKPTIQDNLSDKS